MAVGIVEPGIVDTPAQAYVRGLFPQVLPFSNVARRLKDEGGVSTTQECANSIAALLCHVEAAQFSDIWPWSLTDEEHLQKIDIYQDKMSKKG